MFEGPTTWRLRLAAGSVALTLLLGACGGSDGVAITAGEVGDGETATASTAGAEAREAVLALQRPTLDGPVFDAETAVGRDVLLWFWAPW